MGLTHILPVSISGKQTQKFSNEEITFLLRLYSLYLYI